MYILVTHMLDLSKNYTIFIQQEYSFPIAVGNFIVKSCWVYYLYVFVLITMIDLKTINFFSKLAF